MSEILSFIFGGIVGFVIMFFVYRNNSKKIELVNDNLSFRLLSNNKLEVITKLKRFGQLSQFDEPFPYIQTQIDIFIRDMNDKYHFDIHVFHCKKSKMSK
jgi:hypothetical protein